MNTFIKSITVVLALLLSGCYVYPGGLRYGGVGVYGTPHNGGYYDNSLGYRQGYQNLNIYPGYRGNIGRGYYNNGNFNHRFGQNYPGGFRHNNGYNHNHFGRFHQGGFRAAPRTPGGFRFGLGHGRHGRR